jgi:hypothetical protein
MRSVSGVEEMPSSEEHFVIREREINAKEGVSGTDRGEGEIGKLSAVSLKLRSDERWFVDPCKGGDPIQLSNGQNPDHLEKAITFVISNSCNFGQKYRPSSSNHTSLSLQWHSSH